MPCQQAMSIQIMCHVSTGSGTSGMTERGILPHLKSKTALMTCIGLIFQHCKAVPHVCIEAAFVAFPSFFARTSLWYFCTSGEERQKVHDIAIGQWSSAVVGNVRCHESSAKKGGHSARKHP